MSDADWQKIFGEEGYSFYAVDPFSGLVCYVLDLPIAFLDLSEENRDAAIAGQIELLAMTVDPISSDLIHTDSCAFFQVRYALPGNMSWITTSPTAAGSPTCSYSCPSSARPSRRTPLPRW